MTDAAVSELLAHLDDELCDLTERTAKGAQTLGHGHLDGRILPVVVVTAYTDTAQRPIEQAAHVRTLVERARAQVKMH